MADAPRNPLPAVDIVIRVPFPSGGWGIVLIERRNPPLGWALPGGFIGYGESAEAAAVREAREETGLEVRLQGQLGVYSAPDRDPRRHVMSVVFLARAEGLPQGGDDAKRAVLFDRRNLPRPLCFDHDRILQDCFRLLDQGAVPKAS